MFLIKLKTRFYLAKKSNIYQINFEIEYMIAWLAY